jgi:hypothetical protein
MTRKEDTVIRYTPEMSHAEELVGHLQHYPGMVGPPSARHLMLATALRLSNRPIVSVEDSAWRWIGESPVALRRHGLSDLDDSVSSPFEEGVPARTRLATASGNMH